MDSLHYMWLQALRQSQPLTPTPTPTKALRHCLRLEQWQHRSRLLLARMLAAHDPVGKLVIHDPVVSYSTNMNLLSMLAAHDPIGAR